MEQRRLVGIDLGIATAHTVAIIDEASRLIFRRRCSPNVESFERVEQAALAGMPEGSRLDVVMEPTGAAWWPVAVFFINRGHNVFRVSSVKAFDLRRFLSRHAKSNSIDAETLAKLAVIDRDNLVPLKLPTADQASLDRRVRAADRLGEMVARHKTRIRELVRQTMPMIDGVVSGELSLGDLVILEHGGDPRVLVDLDADELGALAGKASRGQRGAEHVRRWQEIARQAIELYGDSPAVAFEDLAAEIRSEIRLLRTAREEQLAHIKAREAAYLAVDPNQLARSLPGIALSGGPVLASAMGDAKRFRDAAAFKSFTGLSPRASETGNTDRKGQPMSKAGPRRLRDQLVQSANTARRLDPQLAEVYYPPDGRTRRASHQGNLRRCRQARRACLAGDVPW